MKLREIQRLRAVAALMVIICHWGPLRRALPAILQDPWSGVDLFFVISGYVVTLSLVRLLPDLDGEASFAVAYDRAKQALKTFYTRRFFRIMPAALFVALLTRVFAGMFPNHFGSTGSWLAEFVAFFGGVYNYMSGFRGDLHLNVYWSLSVEEHFYLLLPILFLVFRTTNRRLAACAGLALFSILARGLPLPDPKPPNVLGYEMYSTHLRFDSLMAGVALALVAARTVTATVMPRRLMQVVVLPLVLAMIACLPGAVSSYVMHREGFIAIWMLSGILVFYASLDRGYVLALPVLAPVLEYLGARSYALYLVHQLVDRLNGGVRGMWPAFAAIAPDSRPWAQVLVLIAEALVASEIIYRLVEQPCIRLGRRIIDSPGTHAFSGRAKVLLAGCLAVVALSYFTHPILIAVGPRNLARGMAVHASSQMAGKPGPQALTNGALESELGLTTDVEDDPWAIIDLGQNRSIGTIRVYNRDDGYQDGNIPLEVQVSGDNEHFTTIGRREYMFTQEWPWRIRCTDVNARYVRLSVRKHAGQLCLSEVEVFESTAVAAIP